jgi:hypothetical protein
MRAQPNHFHRRSSSGWIIVAIVCIGSTFLIEGSQDASVGLSESPILKHRVELKTAPLPQSENPTQWSGNIAIGNADRFFPKEGLTISREEWATFADQAKAVVSGSELIRLVEPVADNAGKQPAPTRWVLLARFGLAAEKRLVYFRLVDRASGNLVLSADGQGGSMEAALKASMQKIDQDMLVYAWRCRVTDARSNCVIIARGRLDGLREGQKLTGYSLEEEGRKTPGEPDELTLMKYGKPAGTYQVVTVGEEYTQLQPTQGSMMLAAGDVVTLPNVNLLRDRDRVTRGSSLWDKIYQK